MAKTIDNLGIEESRRFAEESEELQRERELLKGPSIPTRTEIGVAIPYTPSHLDLLFEIKRGVTSWAAIRPPPTTADTLKRNLFTHHLIASLGNEDRREQLAQRIAALIAASEQKARETPAVWLTELSREKEESERVLHFIKQVGLLETLYTIIMKERNRYRKG